MSDLKYHVTLTHRERPFSGPSDTGMDRSYHLVGTQEQIAQEVAHWVVLGLRTGSGPITVTPIHPVNVMDLDSR